MPISNYNMYNNSPFKPKESGGTMKVEPKTEKDAILLALDKENIKELNKSALERHLDNKPKFNYASYDSQLDDVMDRILNRDKFSYNMDADALYQQYKDKYIKQGQMAMQDTMGQAAAMTGGYGNSYAVSAGNQAYQQSLDNLNDVIPELYQLAYDKYRQEGDDLLNEYSLIKDRKDEAYSSYENELSQWQDKYNELYADEYNAAEAAKAVEDEDAAFKKNPLAGVSDDIIAKFASAANNAELVNLVAKYINNGMVDDSLKPYIMDIYGDPYEMYGEGAEGTVDYTNVDYEAMLKNGKGWTVNDEGGANWFGINKDAVVTTPNGEKMTLQALRDKLIEGGMSHSDATALIKDFSSMHNIK